MNSRDAFRNLRNIFADLYGDESSARRLAHDAGLNMSSMNFSSRSIDNWHSILQEAINANRVSQLLNLVLTEYPDNPRLRAAVKDFLSTSLIDPASVHPHLQLLNNVPAKRPSFWERRSIQWIVGVLGLLSALVTLYVFVSGRTYICDAISLPYLCRDLLQPLTGYDFETSIQGWDTSEASYKLATIESTADRSYSGQHSLKVTTELYGGASDDFISRGREKVFSGTEAKVYFSRFPPQGIENSGPYNLTEKTVSCYVYFPSGLVLANNPESYVRLFVKEISEHNQYAELVNISASNVEQWVRLSLKVGVGSGMDSTFDPTKANALGVRVELPETSKLSYVGPFYIDRCAVEYP